MLPFSLLKSCTSLPAVEGQIIPMSDAWVPPHEEMHDFAWDVFPEV